MDKVKIKHNGNIKPEITELLNKIITLIKYQRKPTTTETEIYNLVNKYLKKRSL